MKKKTTVDVANINHKNNFNKNIKKSPALLREKKCTNEIQTLKQTEDQKKKIKRVMLGLMTNKINKSLFF